MKRSVVGSFVVFGTLALSALGGCGETQQPEANIDENAIFTQTIVSWDELGVQHVATKQITRREQLAEIEQRASDGSALRQPIITSDPSCYGSYLWLFDQPNIGGNQICLAGTAAPRTTPLSQFPLEGGSWTLEVRSLWTGQYPVYLSRFVFLNGWLDHQFGTYTRYNTLDAESQKATTIGISAGPFDLGSRF